MRVLEALNLYLAGNDRENVQSGLKALNSLARTMALGEENAFVELIPTLLPLMRQKSYDEDAADALGAIWCV